MMQPSFPSGKAIIFNGHNQPFEVLNSEVPVIRKGEILVKNLYTTLCGSDIHTFCGRRIEPAHVVLGHEIVGEIVWIDKDHSKRDMRGETIRKGDRVTWSIFAVPKDIHAPREDMPQKSEQLFKYGHATATGEDVFLGGLADYCVLKENTALIKISRDIPLEVAATISCAHATVAGALRVAGDIKGKRVMVFGAGLLGLSCTSMCTEAGAAWVGITDTDVNRLQWGTQFGADEIFRFPGYGTVEDSLPWQEVDIAFDMTGNPGAMQLGFDSLALGGIAVWIGAVFPAAAVQVDAQKLVRKILQIRGLHNYNYGDLLNATTFVENNFKKYPFHKLVEKTFSLEETPAAFAYATEEKPVRVGIQI